jgi:hypothetical protein
MLKVVAEETAVGNKRRNITQKEGIRTGGNHTSTTKQQHRKKQFPHPQI